MKALVYTTQAKMDGRKVIEPGKCELLDIPEPQLLPTDGYEDPRRLLRHVRDRRAHRHDGSVRHACTLDHGP